MAGSDEDVKTDSGGGGRGSKEKDKDKEDNLAAVCSVCASPAAAHLHYGAVSCYSCRAFFRRGQPKQIRCIFGHGQCKIGRHNRTNCKLCRYRRCLEVGMKPEKVDYYLNKRKERDAEKRKNDDGRDEGEDLDHVDQAPNRSPASEEKIRSRGRPGRRSEGSETTRRTSESLSPNQPHTSCLSPTSGRTYNLMASPGAASQSSPETAPEVKLEMSRYSPAQQQHSPGEDMSQYSPRVNEMFRAAEMSRYSPPNTPQYPDNMARYNSISGPGVDFARYPPEYPHQDRPGFNIRTAHIEAARTQFTDGWRQWPAGPPNVAEVAARAGHVGHMGHVAAISTLYPSRGHQTSVIRAGRNSSCNSAAPAGYDNTRAAGVHEDIRTAGSMYEQHQYIKEEQLNSSSSSDEDQAPAARADSTTKSSIIQLPVRDREEIVRRREVVERPPIFQPYTSVIKRNIDFAQKPVLHPLVNFRQGELPQPLDNVWLSEVRNDQEEEVLQEIKSEDIEADIEYFKEPKVEISTEQSYDDFKVIISKRSNSESDGEDQKNESNEMVSPVPLKKRPRMMEVPYGLGHAINKNVQPVLAFTFEEEFKLMDYIVRIEQYQNRRFEFIESKFPHYNQVLTGIVKCISEERKIPFNARLDKVLFDIGLDFTKQSCVEIYEEMGLLTTEVRREILNFTYPALYVLMFSIMEGNTKEATWVDQQMKTVHITKENHKSLALFTKNLTGVRAVSLKDMEKYTSPWAVAAEDEEKFERTVSYVGRLLRDDIHLQALYHMLVMLSPSSKNSPKIQQNPALQKVRRAITELLYRYLSTNSNIHYSKTEGERAGSAQREGVILGETSPIMKLSEGVEDLSPADKTELLMGLVEDIHDCVDIMENRSLKIANT